MNNQYENLVVAITDLAKRGYDQKFDISNGKLYSPNSEQLFDAENVSINEYHRFEGDSNMSDMSIVYALNAGRSEKGVLIDAYGTYSNTRLGDFIRQVEMN
ncbi:MAG: phosphoribosylpyrophosphate synthetase [Calditrichaeota bacterium]|nr:phosphoribosylpyrophosphate synthetase [Calditrichota bacterium]